MLFQAVRYNDVSMIERQLRQGMDVNVYHEGEPCTLRLTTLFRHIKMSRYCPLHVAVLHSSCKTINFLLCHGADIDVRDGNDRTPLYLAVAIARLNIIRYLIDKGADLNVQTSSKKTALMEAVGVNSAPVVEMLISAGADLDLVALQGASALFLATSLSSGGNLEIMKCLIKGGCNVNLPNVKGATPLMMAVGMKKNDAMLELLKAGAKINQTDNSQLSAFHLAVNSGLNPKTAFLLLSHGADIDTQDKKGQTPLDKAVNLGKLRMIQLLLKADCSRNYSLMSHQRVQYLCEIVPAFNEWLHQEMYNPQSLKRLCRHVLRKSLACSDLLNIEKLPIPQTLKDFLIVKHFE